MLHISRTPSISLRITAIVAAITLTFAAAYTFILAYADFTASPSRNILAAWDKEGSITDATELDVLKDRLDRALTIAPENPEYLERMARLYQWQSTQYKTRSFEYVEANQQAKEYYLRAIAQVPSWPFYWSGLSNTKHALWQFDDEMDRAIQNASRYGPWFVNNQNIILLAGLQGWPYLSQTSRDSVLQILENALKLQPKNVIAQSLDNGYASYLLPIINKDQHLKEIYTKELLRRKKLM